MAQLINVVNFAVESLGHGDTVILHGADSVVDESVQNFLHAQFTRLRERGGRVAYLYDDVDSMLYNQGFNQYSRADYTVLGPMSVETVNAYQEQMQQLIPRDLMRLVTMRDSGQSYLRRGSTNVVFLTDLALGVNETRKAALRSKKNPDKAAQNLDGSSRDTTVTDDGSARSKNRGGGTGMNSEAFDGEISAVLEVQEDSRKNRLSGSSRVAELEKQKAAEHEKRQARLRGEDVAPDDSEGSEQTESADSVRRPNTRLSQPRRTLSGMRQ